MESTKYIGMDVHKDAISIAVLNSSGKLVMESIIETKAITILEFVHGLRGSLHLTFEEGTWKPHVTKLVVCDPRRNDYLKQGSKSDRIDARKLAELLRSNLLRPVYHGEHRLNCRLQSKSLIQPWTGSLVVVPGGLSATRTLPHPWRIMSGLPVIRERARDARTEPRIISTMPTSQD
jgi:hypothetical protein